MIQSQISIIKNEFAEKLDNLVSEYQQRLNEVKTTKEKKKEEQY